MAIFSSREKTIGAKTCREGSRIEEKIVEILHVINIFSIRKGVLRDIIMKTSS